MTGKKRTSKPLFLPGQSTLDPSVRTALILNRKKFLQFLSRRVRHTEIAEEILQQFCLKALNKEYQIKKPESVDTWLNRVLNTTMIDFYRREGRRYQAEAEYARLQPDHIQEFDVNSATVCSCFYELIPTLKSEYSNVIQRIDLRGESRSKVAHDLGISLNLLRVRLYRARQALKAALLMSCCKTCHEHGFMNCECAQGKKVH